MSVNPVSIPISADKLSINSYAIVEPISKPGSMSFNVVRELSSPLCLPKSYLVKNETLI